MSLIDYIEKLQQKPKHVRTRIMWLCVAVSMAIVIGIWLLTLKHSFPDTTESIIEEEDEIRSIKDSLKANLGSFFEEEEEPETVEIPEEEPVKTIQPGILPIDEE